MDAYDLQSQRDAFERVSYRNILHHVEDLDNVVQEMKWVSRLLPTGRQEAEKMLAELHKARVSLVAHLALSALNLAAALLSGSKASRSIVTPPEDLKRYSPRK